MRHIVATLQFSRYSDGVVVCLFFQPSPPGPSSPASGLPNPTLFIENLPDDCDAVQLKAVFSQYSGCKDIRHIAAKKVAFVDYETIPQASVALRCK